MDAHTLLILTRDQAGFREKFLRLNLPDLTILAPESEHEIQSALPLADIIFGNPPIIKNYIYDAHNVRWVQSNFAGVDALAQQGGRKHYILTNLREVYGPPIAEYVFLYLLAFRRELFDNLEYQRQMQWRERPSSTLRGQTICIVGAGSIGKEIALLAKAFGMRTVGYNTSGTPVTSFDEMRMGDLSKAVSDADYVVNVLPNTSATTNIFSLSTFQAMRPTAVFINVGRGNAVVEEDLQKALEDGIIARAVLDVFKSEPLSPECPLWSTKNLFITPHISGYIVTDEEVSIFAENYRRFRAGQELKYRVDFTKGY